MTSDLMLPVEDVLPALRDAPGPLTPAELGAMSNQQLRARLAQSLTLSARHLAYLAVIWAELERRGEDLSDLRTGLAAYLPQIAAGVLDAEAVVRFAGKPSVLRALAGLPLEQQAALTRGEPVHVLTVNAAGEYESADMPAHLLTPAQTRLVFGDAGLRPVGEQRAMLESARVSARRRARPGMDQRVRYDDAADVLRVGRASATVGEVIEALTSAAKHRPALDGELTSMAQTRLTESEHRLLKARAAEAGLSVMDYMRRVLLTFSAL